MRKTIEIENRETSRALFGVGDCHLRRVRDVLDIEVVARNDFLHLEGEDISVDKGVRAILGMLRILRKSQHLQSCDVDRILDSVTAEESDAPGVAKKTNGHPKTKDLSVAVVANAGHSVNGDGHDKALMGRVRAQTSGQERYLAAIRTHDVVFAIGPAGTGKTYLAVASALEALANNLVNRLILVRPAVEAGERLGFLPGDLIEKVNPYLRPLYDALHDMLNPNQVARYSERGIIEIAPLAFMRGRTLNNAFVILDEAQNTTPKQMKMFLTRLGRNSRTVITGDVTQVDLPDGDLSGLTHAREVLRSVEGVSFVTLENQDIVRHPLVQRIVSAYDESEG